MIIVGPSLACAWLVAVRPQGHAITSEAGEQRPPDVAAIAAQRAFGPGRQGIERPLEAEPVDWHVVADGSFA